MAEHIVPHFHNDPGVAVIDADVERKSEPSCRSGVGPSRPAQPSF